jgi:phosphoglycolate phosphatase-like HAD superfamily hydrolase
MGCQSHDQGRLDGWLEGVAGLTLDLDGSLVQIGPLKLRMAGSLLRHPRVLLAWPEVVASLRGTRVADMELAVVEGLHRRLGGSQPALAQATQELFGHRWPALYRHAVVQPSLVALWTRALDLGIPCMIVSDHPTLAKLTTLATHLPDGGGSLSLGAAALGALKPLPDALFAAAATLGVPPSQILHVGDRWDTDGQAAAAAGVRFLHVSRLVG